MWCIRFRIAVGQYIAVTIVYQVQCIIAACVISLFNFINILQSLYLFRINIVNVDVGLSGNCRIFVSRGLLLPGTCLHQVSYLRLRDELGVCLSYCCLSSTTCVLVVIQYTAVYLAQCVYLSYSKMSLHYCYFFVLGTLYHSCVCRGSVIIELSLIHI